MKFSRFIQIYPMAMAIPLHLLHLQCRLRIADLNNYVNCLRIYNDFAQTDPQGHDLHERLAVFRAEIDSISNELHLTKMSIAQLQRSGFKNSDDGFAMTEFQALLSRFSHLQNQLLLLERELLEGDKVF